MSALEDASNWYTRAACADEPTDLFFSRDTEGRGHSTGWRVSAALEVCSHCPVKRPCLAAAVARDERFGVWGGRNFEKKHRSPAAKRVKPKKGPLDSRCERCGEIFMINAGPVIYTCERCAMEYRERNPGADKRRTRVKQRAEGAPRSSVLTRDRLTG